MPHHPKDAATDHDVLEVIRRRWSPRAFDAERPLTRDEQHQLFEAARWAPSSENEQPWRFLVADRFETPSAFAALLSALTESNQTWAKSAPVLILVAARPDSAKTGRPNPYAWYDTGQAVSMLSIQATSMGLGMRQVAGFYHDRAREAGGIEPPFEPVVVLVVGHAGEASALPVAKHRDSETQPRARRPISEFVKWLTVIAMLVAPFKIMTPPVRAAATPMYGYRVVRTYPHDRTSFTQGLIYRDGFLYESAGEYKKSDVRKVELATGKVLERTPVDAKVFAEGLTDWQGQLIQLSWQNGLGFVYDRSTLKFQESFRYSGEGWGLTHDATRLIVSDGVAASGLRFFDPSSFVETGRVVVKDQGAPVERLNELEFVKGEVFANIWQSDRIARINPSTGVVTGWIDLRGLLKFGDVSSPDAVLNGIAYDAAADRLFVTGKLWPKLFEIRLVPK